MKAAERLRTEMKNENWRLSGEQDLLRLEVWHLYKEVFRTRPNVCVESGEVSIKHG